MLNSHYGEIIITIFSEKASELYNAMAELKKLQRLDGHKGKPINEVSLRQQQRDIKEMR